MGGNPGRDGKKGKTRIRKIDEEMGEREEKMRGSYEINRKMKRKEKKKKNGLGEKRR